MLGLAQNETDHAQHNPLKPFKIYFEATENEKPLTAKQFGFYAWNAHNEMDHEIILTRSQSKLKVSFQLGLGLFYCSHPKRNNF